MEKTKNFITNQGEYTLGERIKELVSVSKELKFLVGFFYFSGLKELYEAIKEKINKDPDLEIKILTGLEADVFNKRIVEYAAAKDRFSPDDISKEFINLIKKVINTEHFDKEEFYLQAKFFVELLKRGNLKIRKTKQPNHAKLYLFKLDETQKGVRSSFITGSSNLTRSGLTGQQEFNVEIRDYGFEDAERYFDELWKDSIKITENPQTKEILVSTIENQTLIREITPFEAYVLALKSYLDTYEKKGNEEEIKRILQSAGFGIYKYQVDAIRQALKILEDHNGVILADVVGLGKTVIACAIAKFLKKRGLIVCPPGLMGDPRIEGSGWESYKEKFKLHDWEIKSIGKLEDAYELVKRNPDIEVVIVDEAHRFRSENTKRYEFLKNICRNKIVILLTATPFNNHPNDILSLLKLFTIPKRSSILMGEDLQAKFRKLANEFNDLSYVKKYHKSPKKQKEVKAKYTQIFKEEFSEQEALKKVDNRIKEIAREIRDIIEPVVIRRNRLDLRKNPDYREELGRLPKVNDPEPLFFELTKEQSKFYDYVVKCFNDPEEGGRFKGAIYRPYYYRKNRDNDEEDNFEAESQTNLFNFMRRLLVKRFESSFGAFKQSLQNFKELAEKAKTIAENTSVYVMNRSILQKFYERITEGVDELDEEEIKKELFQLIEQQTKAKSAYIYDLSDTKFDRDRFLEDIRNDIQLFEELLAQMEKLKLTEEDPKLSKLIQKLKELLQNPKRKVIIFSEYLDTVKYLRENLEKHFPKTVLAVDRNLDSSLLKDIYIYFDANALKETGQGQNDRYRILLGTDRISEGFNLNRADTIINYDIPWNPVRLIQRLGRINRIGKTLFSELYVYNFFPTERGADITKQTQIAAQKIFLIHNVLGEDSKILEPDEEPQPSELYSRINKNPEELEEESFYTKVLVEFERIQKEHKELLKDLENLPRMVKVAKKYQEDELLVIVRSGGLFVYQAKMERNEPKVRRIYFEDILEKIKAQPQEEALELSSDFWVMYEKVKEEKDKNQMLEETSNVNNLSGNIKYLVNKLNEILRDRTQRYLHIKDFVNVLIDDIRYYGVIPEYTLKNLAKIAKDRNLDELARHIQKLMDDIGTDYLEKQIQRFKPVEKEIILCIENRTISRKEALQALESLTKGFDREKISEFLQNMNPSIKPDNTKKIFDKLSGERIALGNLEDGKLVVYAAQIHTKLTSSSSKKLQKHFAQSMLQEDAAKAGIFIFYNKQGGFRFSLVYEEKPREYKTITLFVSTNSQYESFVKQLIQGDFSTIESIKTTFSMQQPEQESQDLEEVPEIENQEHANMEEINLPSPLVVSAKKEEHLLERLHALGKPLESWGVSINHGLVTSLNAAFVISTQRRDWILHRCKTNQERILTQRFIKPVLRDEDLRRYYSELGEWWLISIPSGWTNSYSTGESPEVFMERTFPSLMEHLRKFEEKAKSRSLKGLYWWELAFASHYERFEDEKIVFNKMLTSRSENTINFSYVDSPCFVLGNSFFIIGKNLKYLTGVLNSVVSHIWIKWKLNKSGGHYINKKYIQTFPIPPITLQNQPLVQEIEKLVDEVIDTKRINKGASTKGLETQINNLVFRLYNFTRDEVRVIEDIFQTLQ